jgi:hypothetical protein
MTVRAIAVVIGNAAAIDVNANGYNVELSWHAVDDTPPMVASSGNTFSAVVSFTLSPRKADNAIRQAVAADILAHANLTIDPDDVYFPMSNG